MRSAAAVALTLMALTLGFPSPVGAGASPEAVSRIALLTDYGWLDFYVGALKGAILSAWPEAVIEDITHGVPSFDVAGGAFLLAAAAREWPAGTVFVGIVDPGVGTARRPIAVRTGAGLVFVGPDNGLFTRVIAEGGSVEIHEITNEALMRPGALSSTFHGRDIFGPVAAHLASGRVGLADVGPAIDDPVLLPLVEPALEDGELRGQILLADHYGNLITNIPRALVEQMGSERLTLQVGEQAVAAPLVATYAAVPVGAPLATINSLGLLEFAVNQGSMAVRLGAASGQEIRVRSE